MKSSDLREGNFVEMYLLSSPNLCELHKVEPSTLMVIAGTIESKGAAFRPYPLNDEQLKKLGFDGFGFEEPHEFVIDKFEIIKGDDGLYRFYYTHSNFIQLEFVHQLQNLYFALIGEELVYAN